MALVLLATVSPQGDSVFAEKVAAARDLSEARAVAELAAADLLCPGSDTVTSRGDVLGEVFLLKGLPGPAEAGGGAAMSGADGTAADKALDALGFPPNSVFRALSRPVRVADADCYARRVRSMVEAVDPRVVVALDAEAIEDLAAAFALLRFATEGSAYVAGRRFVAVAGFEASLGDPERKRIAWGQFRRASAPGPSL